ncbi:MAG: DHH family phosphoesterase [Paraglaciecola sp.]|nr:DHH family phosphoesterase [Paraglaciecola sp.]
MNIDVFNGDADGIFALIQLRKVNPVSAENHQLITGVKRDISLVKQITDSAAANASICVLDVSFDKNAEDVSRVLAAGAKLFYCDHHQANDLFVHTNLKSLIDTSPTQCTALLINQHLQGAQARWAVAAAYGDGLDKSAAALAQQIGLSEIENDQLKTLGILVNYNGYGAKEADLHFAPAKLFNLLYQYASPFAVIADSSSPFRLLTEGYQEDLALAQATLPLETTASVMAVHLADEPWARRISGTYGNELAANNPNKAVVIITENVDKTLTISLRAPKSKPLGAADICSQFVSGGGRESAAGVNALNDHDLNKFIEIVSDFYS